MNAREAAEAIWRDLLDRSGVGYDVMREGDPDTWNAIMDAHAAIIERVRNGLDDTGVIRRVELEERLRRIEAPDTPWPLKEVLNRLVEGANHMLNDYCDVPGHRELGTARDGGRPSTRSFRLAPSDVGRSSRRQAPGAGPVGHRRAADD